MFCILNHLRFIVFLSAKNRNLPLTNQCNKLSLIIMNNRYCESIFQTIRFPTREVFVGKIGVGGKNPIRIQSMTTSNTRDVNATIEQAMRLSDAGCEIVRVTVQGMKEAESCEAIKDGLLKKGYDIPLVADIHFFPPAAMRVSDFVDKVRINPGNFVDKRASFKVIEYDDLSYSEEIEKIEEKLAPLVLKCKSLKKAMRIGTNHGSLSDRILNRYGDTPKGMVESAFEFLRIARKYDYHDIIFSMKASNPLVMILAYRLLVHEMMKQGWNYPLHLGVTEAGLGEDGRVKSALGIGSLLLDGLGDTIRVSLTEDPWHEIEPCKKLIESIQSYLQMAGDPFIETTRDFREIKRRNVEFPKNISMHRSGSCFVHVSEKDLNDQFFSELGVKGKNGPKIHIDSADSIVIHSLTKEESSIKELQSIGLTVLSTSYFPGSVELMSLSKAIEHLHTQSLIERFTLQQSIQKPFVLCVADESETLWEKISILKPSLILFGPTKGRVHRARRFFEWLQKNAFEIPVILHFSYPVSQEDLIIQAAMEMGSLWQMG